MEDVIRRFVGSSGDGSGYGYGDGSGSGYGYGYGDGYGDGSGDGSGDGYGYGDGDGYGDGFGSGSGFGSGYGSGRGSGSGLGYGVSEINGESVWLIDGVLTILRVIHGDVAKGCILRGDLTLKNCYVAKGGGFFAHGSTLREAVEALSEKRLENMPEEERVKAFVETHPDPDAEYANEDLFQWHHRLTGSCLAGRKAFIEDRGLSLEGTTTVREFIRLTRNAYGGSTIRKLEAAYGE